MFRKRMTFSLSLAIIALLAALPAAAQSCTSTSRSTVTFNYHYPLTQTLYDVCKQRPGYDPVNNPDLNAQITLSGEYFYEWSYLAQR